MLSHRFRVIFVHVPKTGGQSIEHVFLQQHGLSWDERAPLLLRGNADPARGPQRLAHLLAREYVGCGHVDAGCFAAYYKFAVVRDPYERAVSSYRYRVGAGGPGLEAFLRDVPDDPFVDLARHMRPQCDFVTDAQGRVMVDDILRFESLAASVAPVFARVFGTGVTLPHVNRAVSPAVELSAGARALIYRRFEADFDLFGYPRRR